MAKDMLTFDAGDLSDDQLMTVMAVANIAKARMDAVEKGCKAVLDGEELADIQRTAGAATANGSSRTPRRTAHGSTGRRAWRTSSARCRCRPTTRWTPDS